MREIAVVVNPIRADGASYPQRYLTPNQRSSPPLRLQWGRSGSGKTMGGSYSREKTFYLKQRIVEKSILESP